MGFFFTMKFYGNIRKMNASINDEVNYFLPLYDNLNPSEEVSMNELIGQTISISYSGTINCVVSGKRIKKTYGDGMSYDSFKSSPLAVESIIRPELSKIHEGIALRDYEWEMKHHLQPHYVYLSKTAGVKVGVTRTTQVPTRWIDQGAAEAIILAETPYRQAAGLIEIGLKSHISDRTNWRKMLQNNLVDDDLYEVREKLIPFIDSELIQYVKKTESISQIKFPVLKYPEKVKSVGLDKYPFIEEKLVGIKGQYLLFDNDTVFNMRKHTGYLIELSY